MMHGFVIHHYPYQDHDVLLKVLTEQGELMPVIAKGAKRAKSPWRSLCRPFVLFQCQLSGRSAVKSLRQLEVEHAFELSPKALQCAFYVNELILYLWKEGQNHDGLFGLYTQVLSGLAQDNLSVSLREFELNFLHALGFALPLEHDHAHEPIVSDRFYLLQPGHLPEVSERQQGAHIYSGQALLAMAAQDWRDADTLIQAKRLTRQWIDFYLQGKAIKSRELFA